MYLPSSAEDALKCLCKEIKATRRRRLWTVSEMAEKLGVSNPTVMNLEKGKTTVSSGILFSALWLLGMEKEMEALSVINDITGRILQDSRLPKRIRHKKGDNNF